ncbi:hypothetical protein PHJA_000074400 [Phtheirospermum japonicum]|uniref:Uncharacterized protein n=1 Tax=Phtheirospermum japonicum TaxID=374723 RepID=A0A830B1U9_9LAMI|nr:hypothetical protein PHJA_000074400 [Phtheirospermum japonicum]
MGNCSLRAVADAAHEDALRTTAPIISPFATANSKNGVWKVKLVIDPRDLERILSEGVNTEALIERMRFVANSTPKRGIKSSWGEAISYKCADRTVQPSRSHGHLRWR